MLASDAAGALSLPAIGRMDMTDGDAVLAVNLEFYRTFAARDFEAMEALWAIRAPVGCIHPGWPALAEPGAILQSWEGLLSTPPAHRITRFNAHIFGSPT